MKPEKLDLRILLIISMEKVISAGDHVITFNEKIAYLKGINKDPKADFSTDQV